MLVVVVVVMGVKLLLLMQLLLRVVLLLLLLMMLGILLLLLRRVLLLSVVLLLVLLVLRLMRGKDVGRGRSCARVAIGGIHWRGASRSFHHAKLKAPTAQQDKLSSWRQSSFEG